MAETENEVNLFTVYLTGGNIVEIKAIDMEIKDAENRIYFKGMDEVSDGQWTFFISGIAAIQKSSVENPA